MSEKKVIVLFDETGTPTLRGDNRTDWFLGIGVAYEQAQEAIVFAECTELFGLKNTRPLKNDKISNSRILEIATYLTKLPLLIQVSSINRTDMSFRRVMERYANFGNKARREFRGVRERPVAQIIHSQVLDNCLFNVIVAYIEANEADAKFDIFIDDWAVPAKDTEIALIGRANCLCKHISEFCENCGMGRPVSIAPIKMLASDSDRKRFVDVVASTISRAYLKKDNPRFLPGVLDTLAESNMLCQSDETQNMVEIMLKVMERPRVF